MKRKDIIFLLSCTCLVVVAWIIFSVYHASVTSTLNATLSQQIIPIEPNFDMSVFDNAKNRAVIAPIYQLQKPEATPGSVHPLIAPLQASPSATPHPITPTLTLTPTISPSPPIQSNL